MFHCSIICWNKRSFLNESCMLNVLTHVVFLFPSPAGEVVSIAQLASLAGRPVSSSQGSKPVTFQLQGNKLTLSGAQIHQVPSAPPRPVQGPET